MVYCTLRIARFRYTLYAVHQERMENIPMKNRYDILMSVYNKEKPEYLRASLMSIYKQTVQPYEIVLVCDGPLTPQLEQVIKDLEQHAQVQNLTCLKLVRLPENVGLGKALAEGIQHCSCQWIARMDSDDLAVPKRCELQLKYVQEHPETDILSGALMEFSGDALSIEMARKSALSCKQVPTHDDEIQKYIKYRNPMNHPCVMFRKSKVLEAGNYQPCYLFEDYDLWIRMYQNHCKFANLSEAILYMRINDMHRRRGGIRYAKAIIAFRTKMYRSGMLSFSQYIYTTGLRLLVSLMPNPIRKLIYDKKLRNH